MARVLMLVATSVATDTRVLREARTLAAGGHTVHIIGKSVPEGFDPGPGLTVSSIGTSSVFRAEGGASLAGRKLSLPVRVARWALLPQHRRSAFGRWAAGALADARSREFDIVHAHDFTALSAGATLARERSVPLIYDSHELWSGIPREYRPTPLADRVTAASRPSLARVPTRSSSRGGRGQRSSEQYGWQHITVVRNTFPLAEQKPVVPDAPRGLVYAGRVAAFRELEVIAEASRSIDLPITICGPADETWLGTFDPGRATVLGPLPLAEASGLMAEAGLALVTHSTRWKNHRLALPNKLFHAVSLGLPVVATDVDELARLVRHYDLGPLYAPGDPASLRSAVGAALEDFERYACNVESARSALSWEADAARLRGVYAQLVPTPGAGEKD